MTCSTVRRLTKPLDEPKREFRRSRKAAWHLQRNESLAIAGRNLFDDDASSSNNIGTKPSTPLKTLQEHSCPNSSGIKKRGPTPSYQALLKKQKRDDEDERLLSIFKQIHINLPFLEAMIHMPKEAKVLKDLLSHKEKLEKATSSIKVSEECSAIIQRNLPQKEGDPGSFKLPCLIGPLAMYTFSPMMVANSRKHHCRVRPYTREVLVISTNLDKQKNHYPLDFRNRRGDEARIKNTWKQKRDDEDERRLSIFKQIHINLPFLEAMIRMQKGTKVLKYLLSHEEKLKKVASSVKLTRAVINVHEGKLSLRVENETVTFNIGKSMKSKHSRDDYLYYANHTVKLVREQWVDTIDHDGKWAEVEEEGDSNKVQAISFYLREEPVEPLKWKASKN
ncbi:hypothetical protein Tco_0771057 [Tanacetum coccineum]|uniref:Uncharacterized protein n=1 Tax=Tanacetum coccineum TaxID=301880 RepID=A0ABQ4ZFU6_9ASTR